MLEYFSPFPIWFSFGRHKELNYSIQARKIESILDSINLNLVYLELLIGLKIHAKINLNRVEWKLSGLLLICQWLYL